MVKPRDLRPMDFAFLKVVGRGKWAHNATKREAVDLIRRTARKPKNEITSEAKMIADLDLDRALPILTLAEPVANILAARL